MHELDINDAVVIKATGVKGKIRGVWKSVTGKIQYDVRFFDTTQRPCDTWFLDEELEYVSE